MTREIYNQWVYFSWSLCVSLLLLAKTMSSGMYIIWKSSLFHAPPLPICSRAEDGKGTFSTRDILLKICHNQTIFGNICTTSKISSKLKGMHIFLCLIESKEHILFFVIWRKNSWCIALIIWHSLKIYFSKIQLYNWRETKPDKIPAFK